MGHRLEFAGNSMERKSRNIRTTIEKYIVRTNEPMYTAEKGSRAGDTTVGGKNGSEILLE
jgi:hypothetical protein